MSPAKAPEGLDPIGGAAIPLNYLAAFQMHERLGRAPSGGAILIHGGAGGVGTALLDLVKGQDLAVYATASAGKHELIRSYGATPIDYRTTSFVEVLNRAGGADAVYDHIAGKHIAESAKATKRGGRVVIFGFMAAVKEGRKALVRSVWEIAKLKLGMRVRPRFYAILTPMFNQKEHIAEDLEMLAARCATGELKPNVGKVMRLDDIVHAHRLLETSAITGKIVLSVDEEIIEARSSDTPETRGMNLSGLKAREEGVRRC